MLLCFSLIIQLITISNLAVVSNNVTIRFIAVGVTCQKKPAPNNKAYRSGGILSKKTAKNNKACCNGGIMSEKSPATNDKGYCSRGILLKINKPATKTIRLIVVEVSCRKKTCKEQ